jgi:flagellar L-ring protein precursor FlgH
MKPLALGIALVALQGCAPTHIGSYKPKHRQYELSPSPDKSEAAASPGSLWHEGQPASLLFTDARALRANDLVVVKVEEIADAARTANTGLTRSSSTAAQISEFLGAIAKLKTAVPIFNPQIGGSSSSSFAGDGSTARTERLTATVPSIVRKVLPNGNLFIEGHRVVLVNSEEQHFYISGVVRPIDIDQENSVKSSMVADAEIEFTGRGALTDNQSQGFLQKYLGWLWPF